VDYYSKQSESMTILIKVLGGLVAEIMASAQFLARLNTM